jgi:hypothetical protein
LLNAALAAGPFWWPALPLPATVESAPSLPIRRMRWPSYSQKYSAPSGPRTTPKGLLSWADVAGPPSPANPAWPVPATVSTACAASRSASHALT